ncbi:MAG: hypothetical protein ACXW13_00225 [Burkholderiaceae bacterium]
MKKHVMAMAVCLALQPVIALGAETMIQPGVKERDNKQWFEIQRGQGASKQLAKSCIPMRTGNPNGVASQGASSKPPPTRGQKPGGVRNDCDPTTDQPARPRLVHTFADKAKLYADPHKNGIQKYSAIDQRGRALKVTAVQNPPNGIVRVPGDAIERGKQRADQQREQWNALVNDAMNDGAKKWLPCVVKAGLFWDAVVWDDSKC